MTSPAKFQMIEAVAESFEGAPSQIHWRWSDEFKAEIAGESLMPGAMLSEIAHRVGVNTAQIYKWRRAAVRACRISTAPMAAKSLVTEPEAGISTIEISVDGATIRCDGSVDEAHPRCVIRPAGHDPIWREGVPGHVPYRLPQRA